MNFEQARFNMIEQQIRPWDVLDQAVLQLLATVKREDFVPLAYKQVAFTDMEIPLQPGAKDGLVMLAPKVEARTLQDLAVHKHEKVLEIGTGSGYMAALLSHKAQRVISLEINETQAQTARANLQKAGIHNCEVRVADGSKVDLSVDGPFDVIVLSGSVASVPESLKALLKPGGRLAAIVGNEPVMCATFISKAPDGSNVTTQPWDTLAPRLLGFADTPKFSF
ncbi:MAG: protein-L-isoaspartate O-methyltransferase [Burkholderiales bacterium]|nr:MAG: protein-L-isoaspartate O-methyltransferase [Burkholderiales bacterium]